MGQLSPAIRDCLLSPQCHPRARWDEKHPLQCWDDCIKKPACTRYCTRETKANLQIIGSLVFLNKTTNTPLCSKTDSSRITETSGSQADKKSSPKRDSDMSSSRLLNPFIFLTLSSFLDFIPILGYLGSSKKVCKFKIHGTGLALLAFFPPRVFYRPKIEHQGPWQKLCSLWVGSMVQSGPRGQKAMVTQYPE